MPKSKKSSYQPRITVDWSPLTGPGVEIRDFEHLTPVKIDKCFEAVLREWYRLRALARHEQREQRIKEELAGAEHG